MTVRYSRRALAQLDDILAYLSAQNPQAASDLAARIDALLALLEQYPAIGRRTDARDVRVVRASPFPFLIFYREEGEFITVLRIRHAARDRDWRTGG